MYPSDDESRPEIDLERDRLAGIDHDWTEWIKFDNDFPIDSEVVPLHNLEFEIDRAGAINWDCYSIGFWGMISQRAKDCLWPYARKHLRCFSTSLNGMPYYILHSDERLALDCLDREHSEIELFKCSGRVMQVRRFAFRPGLISDPLIFHVPESGGLLCTESIKALIESTGLKGFLFWDAEKRLP
jgi:hypothetical protein